MFPREPELQHVDPSGALERAVARVVLGVQLVRLEQVVGAVGETRRQQLGLAHQQRRALLRHPHHLVEVPHERIGSVDPGQTMPFGRREQRRPAVATVDMQPESVPLRDVGQCVEIVESRGDGGPRGPDHRERHVAGIDRGRDRGVERIREDGAAVVGGDLDHGVGPDAEQRRRLRRRIVARGRDEEGESLPRRARAAHVGTFAVTRQLERVERGRRAAGTEQSGRQGRHRIGVRFDVTGDPAELGQHRRLHESEHRCGLVGRTRRVERGAEPVPDDGHRVRPGEVLIHEPGMARVDRVPDHQIDRIEHGVVGVGGGDVVECQRHRRGEPGLQLRRRRQLDDRVEIARWIDDVAQRPLGDPRLDRVRHRRVSAHGVRRTSDPHSPPPGSCRR